MTAITPRQSAMDDLDGLLDVLNLALQLPTGDTCCLPRTTLERWARQAGRALLYLSESASNQPDDPAQAEPTSGGQ